MPAGARAALTALSCNFTVLRTPVFLQFRWGILPVRGSGVVWLKSYTLQHNPLADLLAHVVKTVSNTRNSRWNLVAVHCVQEGQHWAGSTVHPRDLVWQASLWASRSVMGWRSSQGLGPRLCKSGCALSPWDWKDWQPLPGTEHVAAGFCCQSVF